MSAAPRKLPENVPNHHSTGRRFRIALVLVVIPAVLATYAAEITLMIRERHPADNDAHPLGRRNWGDAPHPFVPPQRFALLDNPRSNESSVLFPLAGISRVPTELCYEGGPHIVYDSDEHGFNNPFETWTGREFDVALLGDSFVHGVCVHAKDQLGTLIRNEIPATLNLGVLGAGPLSELAVLREYAAAVEPRVILWFFYEGNDIEDLAKDAKSKLQRYLNPAYSQGLAAKQPAVDSLLLAYADSAFAGEASVRPDFSGAVSEILRLQQVRKVLFWRTRMLRRRALGMVAKLPHRTASAEFATLEVTLRTAKREVASWGGTIYLIYLPDYRRFDPSVLAYAGYVHDNAEVQRGTLAAARHAGIPVIDVTAAFAADPNPRRYWRGPMSHYGPNGYTLVARTVLAAIRKMPPG